MVLGGAQQLQLRDPIDWFKHAEHHDQDVHARYSPSCTYLNPYEMNFLRFFATKTSWITGQQGLAPFLSGIISELSDL